MAREDAKELAFYRSAVSLLSPASLRVQTSATPYEAEWQELVSTPGKTYMEAIDEWAERHPTLT